MATLDVFNELNKNQKDAALTIEGPLRIVAGAGSGKTKTITHRIANLLNQGVEPWSILAVTFTNKAANEMRKRVELMSGPSAKDCHISTYHSFAANLIRHNADRLEGFTANYKIIDADDQKSILRKIYKEYSIDSNEIEYKVALDFIEDAKAKRLSIDDVYDNVDGGVADEVKAEVYEAYVTYQMENNVLDFNDLLSKAVEILEKNEDIRKKYATRYKYIHVDEFQDTNDVQYELVKLLASVHNNVCVVGDPDQTIYTWRGANIKIINNFDQEFSNAKSLTLNQNYRSTKNILGAANSLISHNLYREDKNLFTDNAEGKKVEVYAGYTEEDEASWVASKVNQLLSEGVEANEILVLFRSAFALRPIEAGFMQESVPFKVVGGTRFYERQEIKDSLSYLWLLVKDDNPAFERVINRPKRGIGDAKLIQIRNVAKEGKCSLFEAVTNHLDNCSFAQKQLEYVKKFIQSINKARKEIAEIGAAKALENVLTDCGYIEMLEVDTKNTLRIDNVRELIDSIRVAEDIPDFELEAFLNNIALNSNEDDFDYKKSITVMTIHKAKGLEAKHVFIVGFTDGIFPTWRSLDDNFTLEEERRLAYVAITRGKERVYISYSKNKGPSMFMSEINSKFLATGEWEEKMWTREEIVYHEAFGRGEIIEVSGDIVTIKFADPFGEKKLMSSHKSLRRAD